MSANDHSTGDQAQHRPFLTTPAGLVLIGFLAIGGFFLVSEHAAHLFGVLPWLPLAS